MAPTVGISVAMLISVTAIHLPGHTVTVAVVLALLTIGAIVWCGSDPAHRPPIGGLLAAAPVAVLALIPYLTVMHSGIPGVNMDNDMTAHLLWAEGILSPSMAAVSPLPPDYPLGPHAMSAVIAKGLGMRIDQSFSGWILALPLINAWTVLALVRRAPWVGKAVAATVVGMPFLIAAFYGEGSFKEVLLAGIVLAMVALLVEKRPIDGLGRWVPFALLLAGVLSIYSVAGLPWPLAVAGGWLLVAAVLEARGSGLRSLLTIARGELVALGIAVAVLVIALVPQVPRLVHFVTLRAGVNGTGIEQTDLGNLAGPLPGWEAFGVWNTADFRYPQTPGFGGVFWVALVVVLVAVGVAWALRGRRWGLVVAAAVTMLIWLLSVHDQSPYVAAKALVVASPFLLVLAVLPLVESRVVRSRLWTLAPALVALVLFFRVGDDAVEALRISPIGPTEHFAELRSLRGSVGREPTLFLGNDDFVQWELAGVPLSSPIKQGVQDLPIPPQKAWTNGEPLDFDSLSAATLNANSWIITTRDAAGSEPPPQVHLVRNTRNYSLWRRDGTVKPRSLLPEGPMPGAVLDCGTPKGRAILHGGGVAAVRGQPVAIEVAPIAAGQAASIPLQLRPGKWALEADYLSPLAVTVTAPGLDVTLPPNLDRQGPRWPIGGTVVRGAAPTVVGFSVDKTHLSPDTAAASIGELVAVPLDEPERIVPVRRACGKYVDWYRGASERG